MAENGLALDLGGPKQRALLAMLLLHAGEVVSQDRLIEALWEEDVPETAQKALQVHVSGLRKLLGKERLQTRAPGYLLRLEPGELDLERFQALRAQGKPHEALALWRGPPLQDVAYSRFARSEIARLEEERLACLEERIEAELAAGRHAELVGELEALVQANPLRERLRSQLMLSLYRSGRQAEALECYQDARRALTEELGLEPGRALRDLEQAILNQDAGLEAARAQPELETATLAEERQEVQPRARETRKTVTVLSAAAAASTAEGGRLDPEALRRVLARALERIQPAVERHGGSVELVAGGEVTALFGVPSVHEDDARRALRAAVEILSGIEELTADLRDSLGVSAQVQLGISTGEVVVGGLLQPTGEPLTQAHRLSGAAKPGEILLDEATHRLVRDLAVVEPVADGLRLVEVGEESALAARLRSPMVGRARERRRLQDAFEQAVGDRSCQLFTVLGAAGVGKSRLVEEFLGVVAATALVTRGRCLPYGEGITYWPMMEAVREAVGLEDTDSPEEARIKLAAALGDEAAAASVAELIGLAGAAPRVEGGFAAARALFETLGQERPLVIVFDDIHWAEATFLDLVEYLVDWIRDVPILLLCLARPELLDVRPGWAGGKLNATTILLEPLSESESAELVENLAGVELDRRTRLRIVEAAEGNPLFLEEMLALMLERGTVAEQVAVPPTIQALLAARLDRLSDDERAVIERAAIEGKVFNENAVAELSPENLRPVVESCLGSLVQKELIRPGRPSLGGRTYRFRHLLIRDAAYESIPKAARAQMHERFGRWLEERAGERATEYEEIVGYHLEQAYRYRVELAPVDDSARAVARKASERLGSAGRRAFVRGDAPAGVNLVSRAAALLSPDDPARVDLVPNVRTVQGVPGDMAWADRVLTEAVEAAATTGDRLLAAHALVQRGLLRLYTDQNVTPEELHDSAQRAIVVFGEVGDELGLARAWRLAEQAHYLARHAGASVDAGRQALVHARASRDELEEKEIVEWLTIALVLGPTPVPDAIDSCRSLLPQVEGTVPLEAIVTSSLAILEAMLGHTAEAGELVLRASRAVREDGEPIWVLAFYLALARMMAEDTVGAEQELRREYEQLERMYKSHFSSQAAVLARLAYAQGRYEESEDLTVASESVARANDVYSHILWRSTRAKVLARRGQLKAAEALGREAVAYAATSDFVMAHGDALLDLAEVHELADRREEAAASLQEAIGLYELKGSLLAADQARARLDALRG